MDAKQRTSEQIDKDLQELRGKIRALEAEKQEHAKALDKAQRERKRLAFTAHSDKNPKAQEKLSKARTAQRESELALEDLESAISEGRGRFEQLEHEWKAALQREEWEKILALAAEAQEQAGKIDEHINGLCKFLAQHQAKLEELKARACNLGFERAFGTTGVRHAFRRFNWLLIKSGASDEVEKPSRVYHENTYAQIFSMQLEAAKNIYEHRDVQANGQHGDGLDHDPQAEQTDAGAESEAEAGATA